MGGVATSAPYNVPDWDRISRKKKLEYEKMFQKMIEEQGITSQEAYEVMKAKLMDMTPTEVS
jgi:hypothetical protein